MRNIFLVLILVSLAVFAADSPRNTGEGPIGRYQIASGAFSDQVLGTLKIDTVTGKTWWLVSIPLHDKSGNSTIKGWVPLEDDAVAAVERSAKAGTK